MMRISVCFSCIILLMASMTGLAAASPGKPGKIIVAYTEWYPYTYQHAKEAKGFEIDIFRAVMKRMGKEVEFVQFPFKRCLKMVETGQAHVVVSVLDTPDRRQYIIYPEENISISRTLFFTRADSAVRYDGSLKKLENYSIGVIAGFSYGKRFNDAKYLKREEVLNAERLVNMVLGGKYDLGIENETVVKAVAVRLGVLDSIRFLTPPVHTEKLYAGFSKAKNLRKFSVEFSRALRDFKRTEDYRAVLRSYGVAHADMAPGAGRQAGD